MGNYHFESNSQLMKDGEATLQGCDFHGKLPF